MNQRFIELHADEEKVVQDGPKEYLLCDPCEQRIATYEKYFKEALHLSRHGTTIAQAGPVAIIESLDYVKTRLCLLSILWRMSISSRWEFTNISLGDHEETIRSMILADEAGGTDVYRMGAMIPLVNGRMEESWTAYPFAQAHSSGTIYGTLLGGILYSVYIDIVPEQERKAWLLQKQGRWCMLAIDCQRIPLLMDFLRQQFGQTDIPNSTNGAV